jgi:hypothetical protein
VQPEAASRRSSGSLRRTKRDAVGRCRTMATSYPPAPAARQVVPVSSGGRPPSCSAATVPTPLLGAPSTGGSAGGSNGPDAAWLTHRVTLGACSALRPCSSSAPTGQRPASSRLRRAGRHGADGAVGSVLDGRVGGGLERTDAAWLTIASSSGGLLGRRRLLLVGAGVGGSRCRIDESDGPEASTSPASPDAEATSGSGSTGAVGRGRQALPQGQPGCGAALGSASTGHRRRPQRAPPVPTGTQLG